MQGTIKHILASLFLIIVFTIKGVVTVSVIINEAAGYAIENAELNDVENEEPAEEKSSKKHFEWFNTSEHDFFDPIFYTIASSKNHSLFSGFLPSVLIAVPTPPPNRCL